MTKKDLQTAGCSNNSCWSAETLTDAGVTAILGAGWDCFKLDEHFSNAHRCVRKRHEISGLCDGVAVHPQIPCTRLVENKSGPRIRDARPKLRKGAEWTLGVPGAKASELVAECHLRAGPRSSYRPRPIDVVGPRSTKVRIPFSIWANGSKMV
jgi:hypothetical protein